MNLNPFEEVKLMRGVETAVHCNKHFPNGVRVFTVNTLKARYKGMILGSNLYLRRKFDNLLFFNNPDMQIRVNFV